MLQRCSKTYCCWRCWHCWHQKIWKKHIFFSSLLLLTLLTSHLNNYLDCHICLSIRPWFCPCVRGSVRASVVPFVRVSEKKLHFLQYYHKKPLIKVAWYVSWVKNMHPGSPSDSIGTAATEAKPRCVYSILKPHGQSFITSPELVRSSCVRQHT